MKIDEESIAKQWQSTMKSGTVENRIIEGIYALEKRGYDVSQAKKLIKPGTEAYQQAQWWELQKIISMIHEELRGAPKLAFDTHKPGTWEELKESWNSLRNLAPFRAHETNEDYYDKTFGGWYGKCIGVALGDPMAGWPSAKVREVHGKITNYVKQPETKNDDINYQLVVLHCIDTYGVDFSSRDLGYEWIEHLPLGATYTAEERAMENLLRGITPPYSARDNNPFVDWIGAQMRGEVHGFIAPARPDLAAEFAYKDAVISHEKEGVYGEVFNAVMVSLAFIVKDVEQLIDSALGYVPRNSEFHSVVSLALKECKKAGDWERVLDWINREFGDLHWIHTFPNIAIVVMSLVFGKGDFGESIRISASCGWDCDCSTGQVGATVGTLLGANGISLQWKDPIADRLETDVRGFESIKISELAKWTCRVGEKVFNHRRKA
jgi:ADP-ribosylglycohydrolase